MNRIARRVTSKRRRRVIALAWLSVPYLPGWGELLVVIADAAGDNKKKHEERNYPRDYRPSVVASHLAVMFLLFTPLLIGHASLLFVLRYYILLRQTSCVCYQRI
jgi:hypothetical protein